jgi:hypothetical protein
MKLSQFPALDLEFREPGRQSLRARVTSEEFIQAIDLSYLEHKINNGIFTVRPCRASSKIGGMPTQNSKVFSLNTTMSGACNKATESRTQKAYSGLMSPEEMNITVLARQYDVPA